MIKKVKFAFIFLAIILLPSCEEDIPESPPYIITVPVFELSGNNTDFTYAGISFGFMNKSEKTVDSVTASFMLFDSRTQSSPFIGRSNIFEITKLIVIPPGENREVILSLDSFIHIAPKEPYLIDFFYISAIHYTDGSEWEDKYGTYSIRGLE